MRSAILSVLLVLTSAMWGAEKAVEVENGRSPDGRFLVRIQPPEELGAVIYFEVCRVAEGVVVGKTDAGGYASFPLVAEAVNTAVLWSPDSQHFALMTRGTKRSWEMRVFHITSMGMAEILLPSPTKRAMELVKATETHRVLRQQPLRWVDNRTLVVRASGDGVNPDGSKIPLWYEVEVTYDIEGKKISAASVIEVKPNEG